ncbi:HEAT repeat domain-containing protein [Streptomyces sp. NPDC057474]|uniref:HEAT repeat domain-containing protein n=1 Tax=Streptomyces sp. NPDC057474 TaxID=3346144 RepID=UPI00367C581B
MANRSTNGGVRVAELSAEALDTVPWDRLESIDPNVPPKEVRRVLRRLFRKGPESTENDCWPLFNALGMSERGISSVATAALPFVVALAADPRTGARAPLVELLAFLSQVQEKTSPESVDPGWSEAWRHAHHAAQSLLADPDPAVRREAVPLADGPGRLLERWRAERDLSVRLPVLFTLGRLATAPDAETTMVTETRAVLDALLEDPDPVLRVAAVEAYAELDTEVPVRELDLLSAALTDPTARSRWGTVWYEPHCEYPFDRESVTYWTAALFDDTPAQLRFLTRLSSAADPGEDADLLRAVLDRCLLMLVSRRSVEPAVLPLAGGALHHPDPSVRVRAAHLLGTLGPRATAYADQLAGLLDDSGEAELLEGAVSEHACWALTRMDDPRALPGLVDRLCAPFRGLDGGSYSSGEPRRPEIVDVLAPLRAHAGTLLPSIREELRRNLNDPGAPGVLTTDFLATLKVWETDALPALPEITAYVTSRFRWYAATEALVAIGPAAASAAPVLRERMSLEPPDNHPMLHWALWRIGGADPAEALRAVGETLSAEGEKPPSGMVGRLADFGAEAAPYTDRVRYALTADEGWLRAQAAIALWSITGDPGPALPALEEEILAFAAGGDRYGAFHDALRTLIRFRTLTPATEAALRILRDQDHRLSPRADYQAVLEDEKLRALMDEALTIPS